MQNCRLAAKNAATEDLEEPEKLNLEQVKNRNSQRDLF